MVMIASIENVQAATLIVGSGQSYTRVQDAIDAASSGDVIVIYEGIYRENLDIDVSVTLQGNGTGKTVIDGSESDAITVSADDVAITGMTITASTTSSPDKGIGAGAGIDNLRVENCNITDCYYGIRIYASSTSGSNNAVVQNCSFYMNYYDIYTYYSDNIKVRNNTFTLSDTYSFYQYRSSYGRIENNTFTHDDYGLRLYYADYNLVSNNTFENTESTYTLYLYYSDYNHIVNNTIEDVYDDGMYLSTSADNNLIENNTIRNAGDYGIYMSSGDYNIFKNNTINRTEDDGMYFSGSANDYVENNTILYPGDYGIYLSSANSNRYVANVIVDSSNNGAYHSSGTGVSWTRNSFTNCGYYISSSTYSSSLSLDATNTVNGKPIIFHDGASALNINTAGQVILFNCDNITIDGVNISGIEYPVIIRYCVDTHVNGSTMKDSDYGIYCYGTSSISRDGIIFTNNTIENTVNDGIYYYYSNHGVFSNNTLSNCGDYGIYMSSSDNNRIISNYIHNISTDDAVYLSSSCDYNDILENIIENISSGTSTVLHGLYIDSNYNRVQNNSISDTDQSIRLNSADHNLVRDNYLARLSSGGINLYDSDYNDVNNNTIKDGFANGILVDGTGNSIRDNDIYSCGISISDDSISWTGNSFSNNLINGKPFYMRYGSSTLSVPTNVGQIMLHSCDNLTITGVTLNDTSWAIGLLYCDNTTISRSVVSNDTVGIGIYYSIRTTVDNTTIKNCWGWGIENVESHNTGVMDSSFSENGYPSYEDGGSALYLQDSYNAVVKNNYFNDSGLLIRSWNDDITYWSSNRISDNKVNGQDLIYLVGKNNVTVDGTAGQVFIIDSEDISVKNNDLSNSSMGVMVVDGHRLSIENNSADHNMAGVYVYSEHWNSNDLYIANNSCSASILYGICIISDRTFNADRIRIIRNNCSGSGDDGIHLEDIGADCEISYNTCNDNIEDYGLYLDISSSSYPANGLVVRHNTFHRNEYGAYIEYADNGFIEDNKANGNTQYGMRAYYCDDVNIANNTANGNGDYGFYIYYCDGSLVNNNIANGNVDDGFYIYYND
ncbi:MAG: right-handed parallel beta-helix repeat-containing protein, partial [Thermoplasmatota archaeon]